MRPARSAAVMLLLAAACSSPEAGSGATMSASAAAAAASAASSPGVPSEVDRHFVFAQVERAAAPAPPRFSAALPASLDTDYPDGPSHPPAAYVTELLCAGDAPMADRLADAVGRADQSGLSPVRVSLAVAKLVRSCPHRPAFCRLGRKLAVLPDPSKRAVGYAIVAACASPDDAALFEAKHAPAVAVMRYLGERLVSGPRPLFFERAGSAALEIGAALPEGDAELRFTAFTLAQLGDKHAVDALLALYDTAKRGKLEIAVAGMLSTDPRAQALGREACLRLPKDPACEPAMPEGPEPRRRREDLKRPDRIDVARIAELGTDAHVRRTILPRLDACARAGDDRLGCILRLAQLDRASASELAKSLKKPEDWAAREDLAAIVRFSEYDALVAHLTEIGFYPAPPRKGRAQRSVRELLETAGHIETFDAETDRFPNQHDALLVRLTRLASPDLAGAVFEETPPAPETGPYRICGYYGGERWCTAAKNLGDWYDLDATLGLLNAMARDLGAKARYVTLATSDQTAHVLGGPGPAIAAIAGAGLVELGGANDARKIGRAAEEALTRPPPPRP